VKRLPDRVGETRRVEGRGDPKEATRLTVTGEYIRSRPLQKAGDPQGSVGRDDRFARAERRCQRFDGELEMEAETP
jgi:hypothetical protein